MSLDLSSTRNVQTESPFRAPSQKFLDSNDQLTLLGVLLFIISLATAGSAFESTRPIFLGLAVHPFLIPLGFAFLIVGIPKIKEFPQHLTLALAFAAVIYCFSVLQSTRFRGEIIKLPSGIVTIITTALLVRSRKDFLAGVVGLGIGMAVVALFGVASYEGGAAGLNPMEVGNKNAFSLYALPALLLIGYAIVSEKTLNLFFKIVLGLSAFALLLAIFLSANRSGYVGAVLIGLMLSYKSKAKGAILVLCLAVSVFFVISQLGFTEAFEYRLEKTRQGYDSDVKRIDLMFACLEIGLENPLLGVSPGELGFAIKEKIGAISDSHNVFAHIWAGSGLLCFAALTYTGIAFWKFSQDPRKRVPRGITPFLLLKLMLILWVFRGMFTREILYNPGFCIGIGIIVGYCMVERKRIRRQALHAKRLASA